MIVVYLPNLPRVVCFKYVLPEEANDWTGYSGPPPSHCVWAVPGTINPDDEEGDSA